MEASPQSRRSGTTAAELNKLKRAYVDALNGVCKRLGLTDGTGLPDMPEIILTELDRRLMPEGMEWLVEAWPRFEDDAPVRFLDDFERYGEENGVSAVTMYSDGSFALNFRAYWKGEHVNRPAPKVLDADGVEIREKGDVWWICDGDDRGIHAERLRVETIGPNGLIECSPYNGGTWVYLEPSELYVNKPVLAADGKPLREGETVWSVDSGTRYTVEKITDELIPIKCCSEMGSTVSLHPSQLTHERPESKCRDCKYWQKDPTADNMGVCWFLYHEYEGEDCYAARTGGRDACEEFVRRAERLAERGR